MARHYVRRANYPGYEFALAGLRLGILVITINDIRNLNFFYDPGKHLPENWQGTVADILRNEAFSLSDRIWIALGLVDEKTACRFAAWCRRRWLKPAKNHDTPQWDICDTFELYANGKANDADLDFATEKAHWPKASARGLARHTAWNSVRDAAESTWWQNGEATERGIEERKKQIAKLLEMIDA